VWWADTRDQSIGALATVLSDSEFGRAGGYHREQDRRRFITACWLLRTTVAAQLGTTPEEVQIDRRCTDCGKQHGKPSIRTDGDPVHVSISHSGYRVAVALSLAGPVGVDVEELKPDPGGIPQMALSPLELKTLQTLPERDQEMGFIRMWVRKEALLKATGHGLRISPDQVEVSGPREAPALLGWPLDISPDTVELHHIDPGSGYAGAVAILAEGHAVRVFESEVTWTQQNDFSTSPLIAA
jgi:4'-phosphopantetheinyl transferase